jgi:glycosyltransferase involved in cell wall biosynthesis
MQCGTPVLSGNQTSLPEIGGDAVHYCDPFSVEDIYEQLNTLLANPDLLKNYSQKGLIQAEKFSWEDTAKKLWESFERMV